jgi:hypothetical protein
VDDEALRRLVGIAVGLERADERVLEPLAYVSSSAAGVNDRVCRRARSR